MNNQEAIKIIKMHRYEMGLPNQGSTWKANADTIACDVAITAIEAQQADMWIPISSGKMPERKLNQPKRVLITTSSGYVYEAAYIGNRIFCMEGNAIDVMAWQDMPERWKEEQ